MSASLTTQHRPGACHEATDAAAGSDFLESPLADAASLALFALLGAIVAEAMWLLPPAGRVALAVAAALAGPLGCAIERGQARPLGWVGALVVGAGAALAHAGATAWLGPTTLGAPLALRMAVIVAAGAALARFGARLDRGEAGWRAAARCGPPDGASPLAGAIAARRLPAPARLLLLPLELPLRAALLASIRLYQLTFSRLMPPACRFEPTCSRYGFEALWRHGAVRGTLLTGLRVLRCSPLGPGGLDPVPRPAAERAVAQGPDGPGGPVGPDGGRAPGCPGAEVSSEAVHPPPATEPPA